MLDRGTKVKLKSFNNTSTCHEECDPSENYWSLIGEMGTIRRPENDRGRVLVQFDNSVKSKGLHCHNGNQGVSQLDLNLIYSSFLN
ncbi:hypothetical protein [Methylophaga sulfidovorans]|uniref:Uncharacterized protein n=1 Tax=Methylophaga sulfidovorans TaxID=45496 RepID=A0A1I3UJ15_9GAMM|nr:hypothetical protein [Methylophaga sulfidovorans]SFJ83484.1 hypothetical protein SAMN04488079_1023 [Methylophaga sulfidovorans]